MNQNSILRVIRKIDNDFKANSSKIIRCVKSIWAFKVFHFMYRTEVILKDKYQICGQITITFESFNLFVKIVSKIWDVFWFEHEVYLLKDILKQILITFGTIIFFFPNIFFNFLISIIILINIAGLLFLNKEHTANITIKAFLLIIMNGII